MRVSVSILVSLHYFSTSYWKFTQREFKAFQNLHYLSYIDDLGIVGIRKERKINLCYKKFKFLCRRGKYLPKSYQMSINNWYLWHFYFFLHIQNFWKLKPSIYSTFSASKDTHITFVPQIMNPSSSNCIFFELPVLHEEMRNFLIAKKIYILIFYICTKFKAPYPIIFIFWVDGPLKLFLNHEIWKKRRNSFVKNLLCPTQVGNALISENLCIGKVLYFLNV